MSMEIHKGNRLKYLLEQKGENLVQLAATLNISRSTLYNYFAQEDIPVKKLKAICEAANIEWEDFLPANVLNENNPEYKKLTEQIRNLEDMVRTKDVIIIQQSEMIELLKTQKQRLKNKQKK